MAVDANVLIFERIKEEIRGGRTIADAVATGFSRAWTSIRDSNTSSIITACILFWFGTSLIQGFALTFGMGVLVSMLSAITISRLFMKALGISRTNKFTSFLFGSGFTGARAKSSL
jgi:protein-export membrane protein SecD